MSKDKNKTPKNSREKLALAEQIKNNTEKVTKTYDKIESAVIQWFRNISNIFNKTVFSPKLSRIFSLLLAIILYFVVNEGSTTVLNVSQSSKLYGIPVTINYNSEVYEISGIPSTVDVIVSGDASDISLQKSQMNSTVVADLSGLTEGIYTIKLIPSNFISRLDVDVLDTPSVTVTIKKKVTAKYNISYEIINSNAMDSIYSVGDVEFESTEVLIRASEDTLSSISIVKALIDVRGATEDFTQDCKIVAYDQSGNVVDCDIVPETISANVTINNLSKEVPIEVQFIGTLPDGLAIDVVSMDSYTVTLYGQSSVLDNITSIPVEVDVSNISSETALSLPLTLPSGVTSMDITRVNVVITVDKVSSKVVENVPIQWINYNSDLEFSVVNESDVTVNVVVYGTTGNLDKITASDINAYIDMTDVNSPGVQSVPLYVTGTSINNYVTFEIEGGKSTIEIQVKE